MRETEAKASSLTTRVERQTVRINELEKQNKDYEKKSELLKNKIKQWEQNSKFAIENALAKQAAENEKLMNEIAQLRLRLVSKAETIGAMQFNNSNVSFINLSCKLTSLKLSLSNLFFRIVS